MEKAKVFFTKEISSESLLKLYDLLQRELPGNVAVKYLLENLEDIIF